MNRPSPCESSHLETGSNVLVQVEPGQSMFDVCSGSGPDENVLAITYEQTPGEWYAEYRAGANARPKQLSVVTVGETTRAGAGSTSGKRSLNGMALTDTVASPAETGELCQRIKDALDGFPAGSTVAYFDSLTALLRYVDPLEATRFLHATSWKVRRVGATAYYRFDRHTHDGRLAIRLEPMFDETRSTTPDRNDETSETRR